MKVCNTKYVKLVRAFLSAGRCTRQVVREDFLILLSAFFGSQSKLGVSVTDDSFKMLNI